MRAALQSDKSFASYDEAIAHLTAPGLPEQTEFFWSQGLLDVLFEYPIHSDQSRFSIQPRLARLGIRTLTVLRFLPPGGGIRAFEFPGDPGLVQLDPRWHQAALQFVQLGFFHILDGADHLLFLVCLVIPFRRFRPLVAVVTAFTVAHSITHDRGGLRSRAGRALVPAAGRNADRHVDLLPGGREHRVRHGSEGTAKTAKLAERTSFLCDFSGLRGFFRTCV